MNDLLTDWVRLAENMLSGAEVDGDDIQALLARSKDYLAND